MPASSAFSRIIVALGALAGVGAVFWFMYTSLGPVEVPPPPPMRKAPTFDVSADVSKNERFIQLRPLVRSFKVEPSELGRDNPFLPVVKPPETATSTTSTPAGQSSPTTTEVMVPTTTLPEITLPETPTSSQP